MRILYLSTLLLFSFKTFSQSKPIMVKTNDLSEVETSVREQRSSIRELAKKDIARQRDGNFRQERKVVRNSKEVKQRLQEKIKNNKIESKKENGIKNIADTKKTKDRKFQRDRRFREKDTHITKGGVRGLTSRKAGLPVGTPPPALRPPVPQ